MLKQILALLTVLVAIPAYADDLPAIIDPLVKPILKDKKHLGLVVAVWHNNQPHVYGYGTVSTRTGESVPDGSTLFEIGSITKSFTGILLADAVLRGEMKLDEPLTKYMPADMQLKAHESGPAKVVHFATHRSGWPVQPPLIVLTAKDVNNAYASFDRKRLVSFLEGYTPKRPAGEKFEYSNLGAGLIGHALANVAHADSYDALLRERICKPLRLPDTTEALTGAQQARLARGHNSKDEPTTSWDFATLSGCGAIRSTANDLLRYAAANLGDVKSPLEPAITFSHQKQRQDGKMEAGLFWVRMTLPNSDIETIWHNGGTGGYTSMLMMVPKSKTAVVVLCSASHEKAIDALAIDVLKALHPKLVHPKPKTPEKPTEKPKLEKP